MLLRPSYVLGGRGMVIVYDEAGLRDYFERAVRVSEERPVLIDRFLEDAFEADVDALCDGETVVIGGVMQHIEEAGIHSGDSACVLPPLPAERRGRWSRCASPPAASRWSWAWWGSSTCSTPSTTGQVYVMEVNPRASRTVPFVSKATGVAAGAHRRAADGGRDAGRLRAARSRSR